ncbi:protein CHROMATIN REMODELING 35 [Cryptomeria japonica]|uniref:protein CHROMATIN REMODELING 35 n=1 Tax=Cryptomeria japonica TaxID=3369 RepID=UPI0027D9DEE9|nr:protein CHROMATIN REMODELING 35 [Cryptomeria japonica]XP_057859729.2 protein CHROMATIN REMODELING 35 [Cryptomeria japonica]XP_057859730.2 protein CHROMATIN REMODELING 35 [Cryptomeria japonica]XP_057859731.2 protein CHROMATIN REMODELING 35 [Cryptomeria japonica]XP_057859732.2 protein CHROMATIN REMODELING 35 [Cryptomeria japonica]XP_057859733.2 protein CHROMATIN REMODELING 35 [Cryptomeria japonica]XP_057859734.2 protein CHROMATIN REMODELING 35 [Cryptomeria japonica]XP_057859735.2 protein CH
MGRRKKCARFPEPPPGNVGLNQIIDSLKGSCENKKFAILDSRPTKKMKSSNEEWRCASVAPDISRLTAIKDDMRQHLEKIVFKTSKEQQAAYFIPLTTPPSPDASNHLSFAKINEEKNSCRRNLFSSGLSSSSITGGSSFSEVMKSGIELKECQNMPYQEGDNVCEDPSGRQNTIKNLDIRDEQESFVKGMPDCICCMPLNEEKLKCRESKGLEDLTKDIAYMCYESDDCRIIEQYQQNSMGYCGESNIRIDGIWEKQKLGHQIKEAFEKVVEDCKKLKDFQSAQQSQQREEIEAKAGGKDELNISGYATRGLQDPSKDITHCVPQNIEKINKPEKVAEEKAMEVDVADYSAREFAWESDMEDESKEEDSDEISLMWKQMSVSFKCSENALNSEMDSSYDKDDTEECVHSFILEDDLGKVCTLCGFIGQSIETIFDIQWPKARKWTKHSRNVPNRDLDTVLSIHNQTFDSNKSEQKSPVLKLVLHPHLRKHMKLHQVEGFDFLQKNLITEEPGGCVLAHAPGTGKTFLVISFIQSFLTKYPDERPLIVAPKSILCSWMTEFKKWQVEEIPVHNLYENITKAETLRCKQLQTLREWKEKKSILLVSYSQFSSIVCENAENEMTACCQKILLEGPGLLVLDEGHFPRNKDTNILNALTQIHTRRRILLSGTLYQNNIKELFNLLELIRPDILQLDSFQAMFRRLITSIPATEMCQKLLHKRHSQDPLRRIFCEVLDYALTRSSEEVKISALHALQELTALFVHYYKGDILEDLPGLVDYTVKLELNEKQKGALDKLRFVVNRMRRDVMSGAICIHPSLYGVYGESIEGWLESDGKNIGSMCTSTRAEDPNDGVKTKFVLDLLSLCELTKEKLVVFSQYLPPLSLLENMIVAEKKWTKSREILRLDGGNHAEVRGSIIEQFNNSPDSKVLLASIKACGEGICLTAASRVVILDIPWNHSISRQAISRAYRIGQKKKVYAYRLVAVKTQEELIHQVSLRKELMSKMVFEGNNQSEESISLLAEVNQDDCEDMFFQSGSPLRQNLHSLYKQILV